MSTSRKVKTTQQGRDADAIQKAASVVREAAKAAEAARKVLAKQAAQGQPLTKGEIEELIQKTVTSTLTSLGIHVKTDKDIEEFRKDMEYTRAWRQNIQKTGKIGWGTFVTVSVGGLLSMLWVGLRVLTTGHP